MVTWGFFEAIYTPCLNPMAEVAFLTFPLDKFFVLLGGVFFFFFFFFLGVCFYLPMLWRWLFLLALGEVPEKKDSKIPPRKVPFC